MTTQVIYNVSLEAYPRVHYPALVATVTQDSASRLNGQIVGGLEGTGLTKADHTWLAFNNGHIVARYVNDPPQIFAGNAGHAATKAYDIAAQLHIGIIEALAAIKRSIIAALGATICSELQNVEGVITQSPQQLMQFLFDNYGTPSEDDIKYVKAQLREKFSSDSAVFAGAIRHGQLFAQLASMGQAENAASKMVYYEDAISELPASVAALTQYKTTTLFGRRTIVDMYTFVRNNYSNYTATMQSHGYVNAAINTSRQVPAPAPIDASVVALTALVNQLIEETKQAKMSKKSARSGQGASAGPPRPSGTAATTANFYCSYHGVNRTHNGSECKFMADPSRGFSIEQRARKSA
jgi:hypothetical protein